jgi:glycosyltransferase involved in cell wall biosynthesis
LEFPSYNQGEYLAAALSSIAAQDVATEIIVMDGGSTDNSVETLERWSDRLAFWRSARDGGQAAAINEGMSRARGNYVCWLNSDDLFEPGGLRTLIRALEDNPAAPAAYGDVADIDETTGKRGSIWVEPFDPHRLAVRCIISQPGTLVRRSAWEAVGGVDGSLYLAMDYDLWWRLYNRFGPLVYVPQIVAVNRTHQATKTRNNRAGHYAEAMAVVRKHYGRVPLKWWLAQPYAVWWKALAARLDAWTPG